MSEAMAPTIRFGRDEINIEFKPLFGLGCEGEARRFLRRIFAFPQVASTSLQPRQGSASVRYRIAEAQRKSFMGLVAAALEGTDEGLDDDLLPRWRPGEAATLHRFESIVSMFEIDRKGPSKLQLRHPALSQDAALGRRIEEAVAPLAGVNKLALGPSGKLIVDYGPKFCELVRLIRLAEAQLVAPGTSLSVQPPHQGEMGLANATLGLAALGEFALPAVLPVCVGILVVSNLDNIRRAGSQLSQGKLGLPVLYTALLGCSITTGQIVAHALMDWSFRFWAKRSNMALAQDCRGMVEENLPIPAQARLVRSPEVDAQVPSDLLRMGHRVRIQGPEAIPADGKVVDGFALVDETSVCGSRNPVRKASGDQVLAGSKVLAGQIEMEVLRTGPNTQAAQVARCVIDCARGLGEDPMLRRQAEAMADRKVPGTLAIAGVGWAVGGLFTVGAVLHQDYASGPNLAIPLETLQDMDLALRKGVLVRTPSALSRLSASRFLVLDDHPAWSTPAVELEGLHSRLAESETNNLLRYVAGAGLYLGDERSQALAKACHELGMVVRQPPLLALDEERLTVRQGGHTMALRNADGEGEGSLAPLAVEIDGEEIARLNFRLGSTPRAYPAIQQLRRQGIQVFLLSSLPEPETGKLARSLGVELYSGDFSRNEKIRFLEGLRKRGVLAAHLGNGQYDPQLASAAHVCVSMGGNVAGDKADIAVLGDSLDALADTFALAQGSQRRIQQTCRHAQLPNLFCIAGGYAGVLNGITSGLIANIGVNRVYQQATRSLRESRLRKNLGRISP